MTPTLTLGQTPVGNTAQFLYNNGVLSFDPDGVGSTPATAIATLAGSPSLSANVLVAI
uniref:Uncharacterized protein n=1 Tax=Desertifilum tharense IPPAS B-1220 TaxID=1781255 RepID=A0ACD5GRC0_9CYAN